MTDRGNKTLMIIGIVLVIAGVLALAFGGIPQDRDAIEVGQTSIGITETTGVPEWLAWLGIGVGAIMTVTGFVGKKKP